MIEHKENSNEPRAANPHGPLDLELVEVNMFHGQSRDFGGKSVYGGQVIRQALVAAARAVDESVPHSQHTYLLRPGDMAMPIVYEVDRVRVRRSSVARSPTPCFPNGSASLSERSRSQSAVSTAHR
jgi:acyl-CoA thioesterase